MKSGKLFESATKRVVEKLHPSRDTRTNVRVMGKFTKYPREIDVQLVDPSNYEFVAFECKDHKAKIDVEYVESFITKLQDVGATKGAIVSNSGFTQSAQNIAKVFKVDTLALVDSGDPTVRTKIFTDLMMEDIFIKSLGIGFSSSSMQRWSVSPNQYTLKIRAQNTTEATAYHVFSGMWNDEKSPLSQKSGNYRYLFSKEHGVQMKSNEGEWIDLDTFEFNYEVKNRYFRGKLEMIDTCGLYDVRTGIYKTQSMTTAKIDPYEISQKFPEITFEEYSTHLLDSGMRIGIVSEMPVDYMGQSSD